jgi:hypothetical protein
MNEQEKGDLNVVFFVALYFNFVLCGDCDCCRLVLLLSSLALPCLALFCLVFDLPCRVLSFPAFFFMNEKGDKHHIRIQKPRQDKATQHKTTQDNTRKEKTYKKQDNTT